MSAFEDILNEPDEDVSESPMGDVSTATAGDEEPTETQVESPAPAAAEVATDTPSEAPTEGYKQDARGVWHRPDGTIASKEEVEKVTAAAAPPPDPVAVPETPAATEAPPVNAVPFRYRANGQTHEIPGATVDASTGRVTIEGEGVSTIRQALNSHTLLPQYQSKVAEMEREIAKRGPAESKADALVAALSEAIEHPDEETAITKFFELRQSWPVMVAKAEADHWRSQATRGAPQRPEAASQQPALPAPEVATSTTNEYIEQMKLDTEFRALTDTDWKQIGESLARTPYAFIRPATADEVPQYGVTPGELVFDTDALASHVQTYQTRTQAAREAEAAARKAKEAARFNQQQKPVTTPARPVRIAQPATVTAGTKPKDWESSFKSAWSNDDDDDMN